MEKLTQEELNERDAEIGHLRNAKIKIIKDILKNAEDNFISGISKIDDIYGYEGDDLILLKVLFDNDEGKDKDIWTYQIRYLDDLTNKHFKKEYSYFAIHKFIRNNAFYIQIEFYC